MGYQAVILYAACFGCLAPTLSQGQDRGLIFAKMNSEKRAALVIGNSRYASGPLRNPVNDAKLVVTKLKALGFEVLEGHDLGQKEMKRKIRQFGLKLNRGGVGLFFYAGHGMQVSGKNYLIPVDAKIQGEADIDIESVSVGAVLAKMANAKNRLNIVILDACRDNPFARSWRSSSHGLAFSSAPSGTLIAYSTSPGRVAADGAGDNSIYTEAFARHIGRQGLKVEDLFKAVRTDVEKGTNNRQTPWESSSLKGDFYFNLPAKPKNTVSGTQGPPTPLPNSIQNNLASSSGSLPPGPLVSAPQPAKKHVPAVSKPKKSVAAAESIGRNVLGLGIGGMMSLGLSYERTFPGRHGILVEVGLTHGLSLGLDIVQPAPSNDFSHKGAPFGQAVAVGYRYYLPIGKDDLFGDIKLGFVKSEASRIEHDDGDQFSAEIDDAFQTRAAAQLGYRLNFDSGFFLLIGLGPGVDSASYTLRCQSYDPIEQALVCTDAEETGGRVTGFLSAEVKGGLRF